MYTTTTSKSLALAAMLGFALSLPTPSIIQDLARGGIDDLLHGFAQEWWPPYLDDWSNKSPVDEQNDPLPHYPTPLPSVGERDLAERGTLFFPKPCDCIDGWCVQGSGVAACDENGRLLDMEGLYPLAQRGEDEDESENEDEEEDDGDVACVHPHCGPWWTQLETGSALVPRNQDEDEDKDEDEGAQYDWRETGFGPGVFEPCRGIPFCT